MSKEFSPEEDDQMPEKKSSQQLLLLLLLLLIVTFAYLYFFTGMIRPRETPPTPQPAPQAMVKKPLPPRPEQKGGQPETPEGKPAAAAKGAEKTTPPPPSAAAAPATKPAPSAAAAPATKPAASAPEAKPAKPAVVASQAKPAAKPPAPAAAAPKANNAKPEAPAAKEAKAAATGKKPAAKAAAEAKTAAKESGEGAASEKKPKAAAKQASPAYVLELKDDLLESEMGQVTAKLKRAGIGRVVKTKTLKGEPMHRLFLADFGNRDEALEELARLKLVSPDAFILKENGRHTVYAGSYLREAKATVEQNRLLAKGVKLLIRSATAPVAVVKVRAGSFADQASAEKAAKALKKGGLSAMVVKIGS